MTSLNTYTFQNTGRIGSDSSDKTQQNISNTKYANYTLTNHFSKMLSSDHVNFATQTPTMNFSGVANGNGLNGDVVNNESDLLIKVGQERSLEKLQLFERPFKTIPYLGRGSCDPAVESQLQQGENTSELKSVSTIMEKSFASYALYPTDDKMESQVKDASNTVEEAALDGWIRGGASTREMAMDEEMQKNNRPNSTF